MMRRSMIALALLVMVCLLSGNVMTASAESEIMDLFENAGIWNGDAFGEAYDRLRTAIAADDRATVADLVLYPLRVNHNDGEGTITRWEIADRTEFLASYDELMTPKVKAAFASDPDVQDLFVKSTGVMVGHGEVWLRGSTTLPQKYGIAVINLF